MVAVKRVSRERNRTMTFINTSLLKHPLNWITILIMLILAGLGGHLLLSYAGLEPAKQQ